MLLSIAFDLYTKMDEGVFSFEDVEEGGPPPMVTTFLLGAPSSSGCSHSDTVSPYALASGVMRREGRKNKSSSLSCE